MSKPLLSDNQMAALQKTAESGMKVDVIFKRPDFESDDLGDGAYDAEPVTVSECKGYLRQIGGASVGSVDSGSVVVASTFELGVPVGTDVKPRDDAHISTGGQDRVYAVQDVRDDETWPAMLNITLRIRS